MATYNHLFRTVIVRSFMFCFLMGFSQELWVQNHVPTRSQQKPVLIDDTNADAMLQHKKQSDYASVLDKFSGLTVNQKKQILREEKHRNKQLNRVDKQIEKANLSLKKQKSKLSDKALKRRINEIANLHIKRQNIISKASFRIEKHILKDN